MTRLAGALTPDMPAEPVHLVLRNARVVDARGCQHPQAHLVIEHGRIQVISTQPIQDAEALDLDLRGRTVVPGLINAHSHICLDGGVDPEATLRSESPVETAVRAVGRLEATVRAGVTTIRDLGGPAGIDIALRAMVDRGEIVGPRMVAAGRVITMTGGHGHWMGVEVDGPDEARKAARVQLKAGATTLKVMATGGMMTLGQKAGAPQLTVAEMVAVVEEAHKAGLIVAAHAESAAGALNAVRAGVDSIEHGHGIGTEVIDLMLEHGVTLTPTILSDRAILESGTEAGIPAFIVERCQALAESLVRSLELAFANGVEITAGNDGGAPLVSPGEMAAEVELYVRHGLTPLRALAAATSANAKLLGLADVGLVEVGYVADLLVLEDDPVEDIRALRRPLLVLREGKPIGQLRDVVEALARP